MVVVQTAVLEFGALRFGLVLPGAIGMLFYAFIILALEVFACGNLAWSSILFRPWPLVEACRDLQLTLHAGGVRFRK